MRIVLEPEPGDEIEDCVSSAIRVATTLYPLTARFKFNDTLVTVHAADNPKQVVDKYNRDREAARG